VLKVMTIDKNLLDDVISSLRPFLKRSVELGEATELTGAGLIDSLGIVQATIDIERKLGMRFGAFDLEYDHFATVGQLASRLAELRTRA